MFRKRDPQGSLFETSNLIPPSKAKRLEASWAEQFRTCALPLIDEALFAPMYSDVTGRPNRWVETVFGVHLLKEMFDLTDDEALEQLEFNLLWQHALRLTPEDAHLCQKTLHNFRARLMEYELGGVVFAETTDRIIEALGLKVRRQRLDSTHIVSNIAVLTRLGLFCETIRVFLAKVKEDHERLYGRVSESLRLRYMREDDDGATRYRDARSGESRRRLSVCARDLYRLCDQFKGTAAEKLEEYGLLERLLSEQCEVVSGEERPSEDDDDSGEGGAPVILKKAKEVSSDSLQSPHDPDVTYSGHKGKGYEVQVAETCDEENDVEIITHVEVTDSCGSDANATVPTIESLADRDIQPEELLADTTYGSGSNAVEAERMGTELISPVGGSAAEVDSPEEDGLLTPADFKIDAPYDRRTVCPAGNESIHETEKERNPNRIEVTFDKKTCEGCALFHRCPAKLNREEDGYVLSVDLVAANIERRRRAEASGEFESRYAIRSGIEATNSELKRGQGLGLLRIRGRPRVELAVYLKALACNLKRMVRALTVKSAEPVLAMAS